MTLHEHINQNGIKPGAEKLEQFHAACILQAVPLPDSGVGDEPSIARVKIFDPCGSWTWYIIEADLGTNEAYGLVHGFEKEYGCFNLKELAYQKGALGIGLEIDVWFEPKPCSELE